MAIDYPGILALELPSKEQSYGAREVMLYALGIGMGADPMDREALRFTYEKDLEVMPTMATVLGWDDRYQGKLGVNRVMVVHGEQRLEVHTPLPPEATVISRLKVRDVFDKGADKGAVIMIEKTLHDKESEVHYCTLLSTVFARGDGGFDGPKGAPPPLPAVPDREPDAVCDSATEPGAALIYRLSGDRNPLHCDPDFAAAAGFPRPILHGLCTYGVAAHAVLKSFCDYRPERLSGFATRFSAPVFPGETIRTEMWRGDGQVQFRARALERDIMVLNRGVATVAD